MPRVVGGTGTRELPKFFALVGVGNQVFERGCECCRVVRWHEDRRGAPYFPVRSNVREDEGAAGLRGFEHGQPERLIQCRRGVDRPSSEEPRQPGRTEGSERLEMRRDEHLSIGTAGRAGSVDRHFCPIRRRIQNRDILAFVPQAPSGEDEVTLWQLAGPWPLTTVVNCANVD